MLLDNHQLCVCGGGAPTDSVLSSFVPCICNFHLNSFIHYTIVDEMDPENFVDQSLLHNFTCLVCLMVVKDFEIVEHSDCKRLFCRPCLEPIAYTSNKCPACSQCVSGKMDKMNYIVRDMVYSKLVMKCSNQGCLETFPLSQREHHESVKCSYRMVSCVLCPQRMPKASIREHQDSTCEMGFVICDVPRCGKDILRKISMNMVSRIGKLINNCTK